MQKNRWSRTTKREAPQYNTTQTIEKEKKKKPEGL